MDTSISHFTRVLGFDIEEALNFFPSDLIEKEGEPHEPEDRELYEKCHEVVEHFLHILEPLMKYITVPYSTSFVGHGEGRMDQGTRLVSLCETRLASKNTYLTLFLSEQGQFCLGTEGKPPGNMRTATDFRVRPLAWHDVTFQVLLMSLRNVLMKAEQKREEHLTNIRTRREALDRMLAAARGPTAKAEQLGGADPIDPYGIAGR